VVRKLLTRFALWLCARLAINTVDHARLLLGKDAVERGQRWQMFYQEQDGLADMILAVRRGYFEAAAALGMSETDKIYEYALADRIAREIDRQVLGVIASGQLEAEKIAAEARNNIARIRR
jgi:hypothetical protein